MIVPTISRPFGCIMQSESPSFGRGSFKRYNCRMVLVFLLVFLLLPFVSWALPYEDAKLFVDSVKTGSFCSQEFQRLFYTDIKEVALLLYLDNCPTLENSLEPENPYGKLKLASFLRKVGREKEARSLYLKVFSLTNNFDEEVLMANRKKVSFLFIPKVLRRKVWIAAKNRETDTARFYLSYLRDDPYYTYLLAYLFLKEGRRALAKTLFSASIPDERYFFLMFLSSDLTEKFNFYRKLMESSAKTSFKRSATVYILDNLFNSDLGLFRKALPYARSYPNVYTYYLARYYALTGNCKGLQSLSDKSRMARALYSACSGKEWRESGIDFYTLLLSPPKKFPYSKESTFSNLKLEDRGLKFLYAQGLCSVISFISRPSPQNAIANYLCGNYKQGIKLALPFKEKLEKYPYLLPVLYPKPPVFGDDIVSLAIARQESLFDERALSRSGAIGLMQIMPFTGEDIARRLKVKGFKVHHLYNPEVNYRFGSYYIHTLLKRFNLFPLAAAAYNCGPGRVKRALKKFGPIRTPQDLVIFTEVYVPFQETRDYVKRTYVNLYYYSNLYGKGTEWKIFSKH